MSAPGWIGVDLDGTLAHYDGWKGADHIGAPVPAMVERVKAWLANGREVRIFTARISPMDMCVTPDRIATKISAETVSAEELAEIQDMVADLGQNIDRLNQCADAVTAIRAWCLEHIGVVLPITNVKDFAMVELYDDRAVQVVMNTGQIVGFSTRGLVDRTAESQA